MTDSNTPTIKAQNSDLYGTFHNQVDHEYNRVSNDILKRGVEKGDRTGTGTLSTFGQMMTFDISGGKIPLITTKKVYLRAIIHELLWFLSGDTNIRYLKDNNINIWDSWVDPKTAEYHYPSQEVIMAWLDQKPERYRQAMDWAVSEHGGDDPENEKAVDDSAKRLLTWVAENGGPKPHLVAGDLPNIYGKQWRGWESRILVDRSEYHDNVAFYSMKGFHEEVWYERGGDGAEVSILYRKVDQIRNIVHMLKKNPDSRRIILNAYNVGELELMALPPCHAMAQFWTRELTTVERDRLLDCEQLEKESVNYLTELILLKDNGEITEDEVDARMHQWYDDNEIPKRELSSMLIQRSADTPLGLPFNIAQYAILTHMLAQVCNMTTGTFKWVGGDTHVYSNQVETFKGQLENEPHPDTARILLNPERDNIDDFIFDDFELKDYQSHPVVRYPAAAI